MTQDARPIPVVAIDGPAASGKSTTGAEVARRLGFLHVDSGSLYRGVTRVALDLGTPFRADRILAEAERRGLGLELRGGSVTVVLEGALATNIRGQDVTGAVSEVSALPEVREWAYEKVRGLLGTGRGLVMDGRDIGTRVFPDAPVKVFLNADPEVRAERRLRQEAPAGRAVDRVALTRETEKLRARDAADSSRPIAPLVQASDAVRLDTSRLGFEAQVTMIMDLIAASTLPRPAGAG